MRFRKLRMAWVIGWGLVCLLLAGMWARSYYWSYQVFWRTSASYSVGFASHNGRLAIGDSRIAPFGREKATHFPTLDWRVTDASEAHETTDAKFDIYRNSIGAGFMMPFWLPVLLSGFSATLAAIPWIGRPNRFSLRILLIATTLVAAVLGLIVYVARM